MRALGVWCLLFAACGSGERELDVRWTEPLGDAGGMHVAFFPSGDLALASSAANGCVELRGLTSSGLTVWRRPFQEPLPAGLGCPGSAGLAVDRRGHIVTAGGARGTSSATKSQVVVRKHDGKGAVLWTQLVEGGRGGDDEGESVAVDRDGNVLVGGAERSFLETVPWVAKLAPEGTPLWLRAAVFPHARVDLQADRAGASLSITPPPTIVQDQVSAKAFVVKRDPDGTPLWHVEVRTQSRVGRVSFALHPDGWSAAVTTTHQLSRISADGEVELETGIPVFVETDDGLMGLVEPRAVGIAGDGTIVVAGTAQVSRCSGCVDRGLSLQLFTPEGGLRASRIFEPHGPSSELQLVSFAVHGTQAAAIVTGEQGAFVVALSLP